MNPNNHSSSETCIIKQPAPTRLRKGLWSPDEDDKLIRYITEHGHSCWSSVPKLAGLQRCGKSCRLRWINYLRPDLKRGTFSAVEESLIIELHGRLGNRWSQIASCLPGRTDNEIKNYWNSYIKRKLRKAGLDPSTCHPVNNILAAAAAANSSDSSSNHENPANSSTDHLLSPNQSSKIVAAASTCAHNQITVGVLQLSPNISDHKNRESAEPSASISINSNIYITDQPAGSDQSTDSFRNQYYMSTCDNFNTLLVSDYVADYAGLASNGGNIVSMQEAALIMQQEDQPAIHDDNYAASVPLQQLEWTNNPGLSQGLASINDPFYCNYVQGQLINQSFLGSNPNPWQQQLLYSHFN